MRNARKMSWLAIPAAVAMLATACGGGGGESGQGGEVDPNGSFSVYATEPENPLVPGNTTEVGGGRVVDALFSGLKEYRGTDFSPYNVMAESIEPNEDKTVFTITIKKGWKFHNGEEVTADNFVKAWNYTVSHGQQTASFFNNIAGYDEASPDPDAENPQPTGKTMSGLKELGPYKFEVTLKAPYSIFPDTLGYSAFVPMPDMFFQDPEAFKKAPVGNGPLKWDSRQPNRFIKLTRYDGYQGPDKVNFGEVTFQIYQSREPAYQDLLSGNLDFMEDMPPSALAGGKYKQDFGERAITADILGDQMITFPLYAGGAMADPNFHKAISMAINRQEIADVIFNGTRKPMTGWVPSELPGAQQGGACGEFCVFDPAKAKEYLAKVDFQGPLTITSNGDGGHKEWITAVCGSIENALGIQCNFVPATNFGAFRNQITADKMTGLFRSGWSADYPSPENFLTPMYYTGGSSNDSSYSNPAFDAKIDQADQAPTVEEATKLYREAEAMLKQEMPSIPLWTQKGAAVHSENITDVVLTPKRWIDFSQVKVTN